MNNKTKSWQKNWVDAIHNYLQKPSCRAIILLPPFSICVIGAVVIFARFVFEYSLMPLFIKCFVVGVIWLLFGFLLVSWSDYQKKVKTAGVTLFGKIRWFGVELLPEDHTHVLTVDMSEETPMIWHNVHSTNGHFAVSWGERKPTHWANINFPEGI